MTHQFLLQASQRESFGTGASRQLRLKGLVPVSVYGAAKPMLLTVGHNDVMMLMQKPGFLSSIIELSVDNKKHKVMLKDYHLHGVKKQLLHMDFLYVKANEKMHIEVPLVFTGQDKNAAINSGAVLSHVIDTIEISCLPAHLPEKIEVDISNLELDKTFHYSDFQLPKGVSLVSRVDDEHNLPVASIHMPKVLVESETVETIIDDNSGAQASTSEESGV